MPIDNIIKILIPASTAFVVGIGITPLIAHYLYEHKLWKKQRRTLDMLGQNATVLNSLKSHKEIGTPRMGGIVIWASVLLTVLIFWLLSVIAPSPLSEKLNFLSNNQTWLPLFTLIAASAVGLVDDLLQVHGSGTYVAGGLSLKGRVGLVLLIGLVGALWFYTKLEYSTIDIPFIINEFELGIFFMPLFMLVMLSLFSGGVIDGLDGLSGGIMASIFASYAGIAFFQNQIDIATLSAVLAGGILAFLWFNIPPARFYMGETGMIGLTATLAVIAFLTRAVVPLFIIAFPLYLASGSVILQTLSKKIRGGKKIFLVAPIHHHFEALGWPSYKVTMRFWVVSVVFAIIGMIIALVG
jgi:phospho-N-acetylmuramoyl-pentapeptide-transferase